MIRRAGCDCGLSLAPALGAAICTDCDGHGCPRCRWELGGPGMCLWCGDERGPDVAGVDRVERAPA